MFLPYFLLFTNLIRSSDEIVDQYKFCFLCTASTLNDMLTSGGDEDDLHADRGEQVFFSISLRTPL